MVKCIWIYYIPIIDILMNEMIELLVREEILDPKLKKLINFKIYTYSLLKLMNIYQVMVDIVIIY